MIQNIQSTMLEIACQITTNTTNTALYMLYNMML